MSNEISADHSEERATFPRRSHEAGRMFAGIRSEAWRLGIYRKASLGVGALAIFIAARNGHYINPEEAVSNPLADFVAGGSVVGAYFSELYRKTRLSESVHLQDSYMREALQIGTEPPVWTYNEHSPEIIEILRITQGSVGDREISPGTIN